MKILQISSHYSEGGAAGMAATLHRQLLIKGIDAYAVYGRGKGALEKGVYGFGNKPGVYISALLSHLTGWNGYFNHWATLKLIRLIKQIQPDMIHMHVLHGYYVNVPMLFHYINQNKIPCVWTFHDCHAFTGNCGYFYECRKWELGCKKCPYLREYPSSLLFDNTEKMWHSKRKLFAEGEKKWIVTPSEWLAAEVKKSFFNKYPCVVINNGIDTEMSFYPADKKVLRSKYGFLSEEKLILGVAAGYRDKRKGVEYIISLAKDLEAEAKVILIGWDERYNHWLKGSTNIVTMKNICDKSVLAEYYSMADVFVIPSVAENYPTTSLEAMACGTPVVGFAVGGITEQLADGKGLIVEAGNQKAFTEAVRKVLTEPDCVLKGQDLVNVIQKENSACKMAEAYLELYERIMSGQTDIDNGNRRND